MKVFIFVFLAVTAVSSLNEKEEWIQFKVKYGKSYQNHVEEQTRFTIFQENIKRIATQNEKYDNGLSTFKLGVNKFADLSEKEFQDRLGRSRKSKPVRAGSTHSLTPLKDLPPQFDWRDKGAVTKVKDQGECGACWTFSTTGTVEGINFVKTGKLISLSEQNLVDCVKGNCDGCYGGFMDTALKYIKDNGGIMSEKDYPYEEINDNCRFNSSQVAVKISDFAYIKKNDENDLQNAVAQIGPIAVSIDATFNFQLYASGLLDDIFCSSDYDELNHGVLAVGYGTTEEGDDYWIVKNSWGADWGMDGYVWMSRNKNNQCGITTDAEYPIL